MKQSREGEKVVEREKKGGILRWFQTVFLNSFKLNMKNVLATSGTWASGRLLRIGRRGQRGSRQSTGLFLGAGGKWEGGTQRADTNKGV